MNLKSGFDVDIISKGHEAAITVISQLKLSPKVEGIFARKSLDLTPAAWPG